MTASCTERASSYDPLLEMLLAECEREERCNCQPGTPDVDCETYAHQRAGELRERARERGATILDTECAELTRDVANHTCIGAGIPDEHEAFADSARVDLCWRTLLHGPLPEGAPCDNPVDLPWTARPSKCGRGLMCAGWEDVPRCRPWPERREGFVRRDLDAVLGCPVDLVCVNIDARTGVCLPFTEVGELCIGVERWCEGPQGQWCDLESGTCRASPGVGEPCVRANGEPCSSDAYCDDGICRARVGPREACVDHSQCALGLRCDDGVCVGDAACGF